MCTGRVGLRESKMRLYFTESERERARALAALLTLLLFSSFGTFHGSSLAVAACSLSVDRTLTAHLSFQFWTYWSLRFMRWMLLVVVASAISVACRAALCGLRRGARPPPAPPGRAHTARTAAGGGRVSRARQATPRTHTCTCTCTCACDMCMCMWMCLCRAHLSALFPLHMCARVAVPVGVKDLPTLTPVNRRPISDVR
jgi:hypothetical protein